MLSFYQYKNDKSILHTGPLRDCLLLCCVVCAAALAYMYPAERQQVVLVLEAEQLLHVLHVAVVGAGRLLGDNHVCQQKLVVHLRAREHQSDIQGLGGGRGRRELTDRSSHQSSAQDAARLNASRRVAAGQQKEAMRQVLGKHHPSQSLHPWRCATSSRPRRELV